MSGIAFQKLNGDGTMAKAQLDKLNEMIISLDELKEKISTPDIKALFKIYFPDTPLVAFYNSYHFEAPPKPAMVFPIGYTLFGKFQVTHAHLEVGTSNNKYNRTTAKILLNNKVVCSSSCTVHGDDILYIPTDHYEFIGIANKISFENESSDPSPAARLHVIFYGFIIPPNVSIVDIQDGLIVSESQIAPPLPPPPSPVPMIDTLEIVNNSSKAFEYRIYNPNDANPDITLYTCQIDEVISLNFPQGWTFQNPWPQANHNLEVVKEMYESLSEAVPLFVSPVEDFGQYLLNNSNSKSYKLIVTDKI